MYSDPIIEEVWRLKDEYARKHDYDLQSMFDELRRCEKVRSERGIGTRGAASEGSTPS